MFILHLLTFLSKNTKLVACVCAYICVFVHVCLHVCQRVSVHESTEIMAQSSAVAITA